MKTWIICVPFVLLAAFAHGDSSAAQTVATKHIMREKLVHTQRLLEAVMTSNFTQLQDESDALARVPQDPGWLVLHTPEYARYSAAFVNAMQEIVAAAKERDLDAAAVRYASMTMTCYQCHRYLKNSRIVDAAPEPAALSDTAVATSGPSDDDGQRGGGQRGGGGMRPSPPGPRAPSPGPRATVPGPTPGQRGAGPRPPSAPGPRAGVPRVPVPGGRGARPGPIAPNRDHGHSIYPYPFWPRAPYVWGVPWGGYPGWWDYPYPYGWGYSVPLGEWDAELAQYGRISFDVPQDKASVFVDGSYAGIVDDYDHGHRLVLPPGAHHIELQLEGYEPLTFDVNAIADHHTKLRGVMQPKPPGE